VDHFAERTIQQLHEEATGDLAVRVDPLPRIDRVLAALLDHVTEWRNRDVAEAVDPLAVQYPVYGRTSVSFD
jgi:hypothetical protein